MVRQTGERPFSSKTRIAPQTDCSCLNLQGRDTEFLGEFKHRPTTETVKPKALYDRVLRPYSMNGSRVVLDYCMYTGLCGEVALELGNAFIGCEIMHKLFQKAKTRLATLSPPNPAASGCGSQSSSAGPSAAVPPPTAQLASGKRKRE